MRVTPLAGQVAVITGASRGIGRNLALHLARKGVAVAAIARPSDALTSLQHEVGEDDGPLLPVPGDVTSPEQVAAAFAAIGSKLGTPSLVVACASTASSTGPLWSADPDAWWQAVSVDLRGTMLTAWSAIPSMLVARTGRFVTVYDNVDDGHTGHVSAFAAAKAGIARLTESLAVELEGTGVQAFAIYPGPVGTPMAEQLIEAIARGEADRLSGRVISVDDDLDQLAQSCEADPDLRRLRLKLS